MSRTSCDTWKDPQRQSSPPSSDHASDNHFESIYAEVAFVSSMALAQFLAEYLITGFGIILPFISQHQTDTSISPLWPMTVLSLVMSASILPFARLSDMYGGWPCFMFGLIWLSAFSAAAGFANSDTMLNICRAMQGLAMGAFSPASFSLMGNAYPPGRRRNIVFGIYAAMASVGFFGGIVASGIALHFNRWGWYFWTASICAGIAAVLGSLARSASNFETHNQRLSMDWLGTLLVAAGLVLVSYALAAASYAAGGWRNPTILAPCLVGITCFALFVWVEWGWAESPLIPADFFKPANTVSTILAVVFFFGSFGCYLFYSTSYMEQVMGATPLPMIAYFAPMAAGGVMCSLISGWLADRIASRNLLLISGVAWILAPLLIAVKSRNSGYFPFVFISMCLTGAGVDLTYTISSVFLSSVQPKKHQGLAGAINSVALNLAIAFSLSFGDIIHVMTRNEGVDRSLKSVFWFSVGLAAAGALVVLLFMRSKPTLSSIDDLVDVYLLESTFGGALPVKHHCQGARQCYKTREVGKATAGGAKVIPQVLSRWKGSIPSPA